MLKPPLCRFISLTLFITSLILSNTAITGENTQTVIRLATTTSTENSGLLDNILPKFAQASGYQVHVIALGTGKALRMGRDGDVVLVHPRTAEDRNASTAIESVIRARSYHLPAMANYCLDDEEQWTR